MRRFAIVATLNFNFVSRIGSTRGRQESSAACRAGGPNVHRAWRDNAPMARGARLGGQAGKYRSGETMSIERAQIDAALAGVIDPNTGRSVAAPKAIRNVSIDGANVALEVVLGYPAKSQFETIRTLVVNALRALPGIGGVNVIVSQQIVAHAVQRGVQLLPNVRNIVAVASGKGGVGKSTTAANLALALAAEGASVGMLDADIYGPSQPMMLGMSGRPESPDGKTMFPLQGHGIQANSIGFLIEQDNPMIWRGPMVTSALEQLLRQTNWSDLDYLIVDMPPGTGDIQLTLSQKVPVTGAVIVTTPQDIALLDAKKGLKMFEKVGVPILGVVENMSVHICSNCGHAEHIFGAGGGETLCAEYGVEYLGSLPLDIGIRQQADTGRPTVVAEPDGKVAAMYRAIARRVAIRIAEQQRDMTSKFPAIVVQNT
jgi:ATP-binding protein involved in chromosome partitioning